MKQFFVFMGMMLYAFLQVQAQAPQAFNYQGVARNASGAPYASQAIQVKSTVRTGAPAGGIEYSETRSTTTNAFGLFNLQIGSAGATVHYGAFATINWQLGIKFLQTEISVNGQPFIDLGTTQIMSVPYALHSRETKDLILPFTKTSSLTGDLLSITNTDGLGAGSAIRGHSNSGKAVYGSSTTGYGGYFQSTDGDALYAYSTNKWGLRAISSATSGYAVYASNINSGYALGVSGNLRIFGGNTNPGVGKVLTSDANGNATWQPSAASGATVGFVANKPAQGGLQNLPNGAEYKLHAAQEDFDGSNNYTLYNQTPSSTFTAPIAGMYHFNAFVYIGATGGAQLTVCTVYLVVKRGATETSEAVSFGSDHITKGRHSISRVVYLNAGDQVWLKTYSSTSNNTNPYVGELNFSGYRIK